MKAKKYALNISLAIGLICLNSFLLKKDNTKLFHGAWALKEFNYGGQRGTSGVTQNIKVFKEDKFANFVAEASGPRKATEGYFKVLTDSTYTETIVNAANAPMEGKVYTIKYKIKDSILQISGTFDRPGGQTEYSETYIKMKLEQKKEQTL